MIWIKPFGYKPIESESEKASLGYLISVLSLIVGAPLPIITLFASLGMYFGYRNFTKYVRWHVTQALLIQLFAFCINSIAFVWIILLFFTELPFSNAFVAYVLMMVIVNLIILSGTVYSASKSRKGIHTEWLLFGPLTNAFYTKPSESQTT